MSAPETSDSFACFGATCAVHVSGDGEQGTPLEAVRSARRRLLVWHDRFTRFARGSELSRLNADPRTEVPVSPDMARFVGAALYAAEVTGGLVDATLLHQLEDAGYRADLRTSLPLPVALRLAPARRPARPNPFSRWAEVAVEGHNVVRPAGVQFDSGGLAKGLFADLLAESLRSHAGFAIDCAGDVRVGGAGGIGRAVQVAGPFDGAILHTFETAAIAVATSGIGRRSWLDPSSRPAHHLLDPSTGRPAFTGIVQASALAPTALEAEIRAKAAVLSGPDAAAWLPDGGLLVFEDGGFELIAGPPARPSRSREVPAARRPGPRPPRRR